MIYFHIGMVIALIVTLPWAFVLIQMLIQAIRGYVKDETWIKPKIFFALYPKEAYWSSSYRRYSGGSRAEVLNGNMIWAWWALMFPFIIGSIIAWPATTTIMLLKGLRMYNTHPQFKELFERKPKEPKVHKVKKERVIKGLE